MKRKKNYIENLEEMKIFFHLCYLRWKKKNLYRNNVPTSLVITYLPQKKKKLKNYSLLITLLNKFENLWSKVVSSAYVKMTNSKTLNFQGQNQKEKKMNTLIRNKYLIISLLNCRPVFSQCK